MKFYFFGHCIRLMITVVVIIICGKKKNEINDIYIAKHEHNDRGIVYSFIT